jgi:hypothetical protein
MILPVIGIDFDNTIIQNPYDVDLGNSLERFLLTWQSLPSKPVNYRLIDLLRSYPLQWGIITNRGTDTYDKIMEHMDELKLRPAFVMCCAGDKVKKLKELRERVNLFLIDNSAKYNPDLMVQDCNSKNLQKLVNRFKIVQSTYQ